MARFSRVRLSPTAQKETVSKEAVSFVLFVKALGNKRVDACSPSQSIFRKTIGNGPQTALDFLFYSSFTPAFEVRV